jgi:glycerol transport system permease protein
MTRAGLLRLFACIALAGFVLLPLVQAIVLSFTATIAQNGVPQGSIGLHNYLNILRSPELRASVGNSVTYVLLNVAFCLIAGLPAAYGLARYGFVGDRHCQSLSCSRGLG